MIHSPPSQLGSVAGISNHTMDTGYDFQPLNTQNICISAGIVLILIFSNSKNLSSSLVVKKLRVKGGKIDLIRRLKNFCNYVRTIFVCIFRMKNNNKMINQDNGFLIVQSFSLGLRFEILVTIRLLYQEDLVPCVLGLCTGRKQDWEEHQIRNRGLAKDQDWDQDQTWDEDQTTRPGGTSGSSSVRALPSWTPALKIIFSSKCDHPIHIFSAKCDHDQFNEML